MKRKALLATVLIITGVCSISFRNNGDTAYMAFYHKALDDFRESQSGLLKIAEVTDLSTADGVEQVRQHIRLARSRMKTMDFWMRYLDPVAYKKINGPLPVEWETEVFEKFEKPYKREGAGLTLAALYLDEPNIRKNSLISLIRQDVIAAGTFGADSITKALGSYDHFFLCNRLYLLNLAAIYTTGFECPDPGQIIPELRNMLSGVNEIYASFNRSFPATPLTGEYMGLYRRAIQFANDQPADYTKFDHFSFIKDYVNRLFVLNQRMISQYSVVSRSMVDYSLNKKDISIFSKEIYRGQNGKGIFHRVEDPAVLAAIDRLGKLLFYDPILSGNNRRSCASCHKPTEYFTDTTRATAFGFNHKDFLPRNTPSLINADYNHLIMMDGRHISLQDQARAVVTNDAEMGSKESEILAKVLSCPEYREGFRELLQYTPTEQDISFEHIASAITFYYAKFSKYSAPFDEAMNSRQPVVRTVRQGFNLFMSKAQCATCHFVPQFNGVKPPYVGSEFEVLGVPADRKYKKISRDKGRFQVNPADETLYAFRTGTVRNAAFTKPYMHNGVFRTLNEVIDFYDAGGGAGRGLPVGNQTLSSDSLKLTVTEKSNLVAFINSLNEKIIFERPPLRLPASENKKLNARKVGGEY